jgi:hypothetical protein
MKKALPFLSMILGVVLIVIAVIIPSGSAEKDSFVRMLKMLPEDMAELTFIDVNMLQSDSDMLSMWNQAKEQFFGEDLYGENVSQITGFGMAGSGNEMMLYAGDFDLEQMTSIIEQGSVESFEYKGITIWTDQEASSTAVIDNVLFVGSSENIQLCINLSNGQGVSLYDNKDARDIIGRLPDGYVLGVAIVGNGSSSEDNYGLLVAGMAVAKNGGNISQLSLLKFEDSEAAQAYLTAFQSQIPEQYDVKKDSQYITISSTSEMPTPEEAAYNSAYNDLLEAVSSYYIDNDGVFPTINGTVNVSGYDLQILDICALLTSAGGMLSEVSEGVASIEGADNDNCDAGCGGCLAANHYIWAADESGIYSTCVGADCEANGEDGYQGVWP